jgi:UDP-N-acetylmuramoyl-L-alanyl-D-glutamate--2,6-diaminopimelate ligase
MGFDIKNIAKELQVDASIIAENAVIENLVFDSRIKTQAALFFAIKGLQTDGHQFIDKAIANGAIAIVCEKIPDNKKEGISYLQVENTAKALAKTAHYFYDKASENIKLVGITGTNGKTTSASLLFELHKKLGYKCGLISTIKYIIHDKEYPASHTTPDAIQINKLLAEMVEEGCEYCFMEVSSHAIVQHRIDYLHFTAAVFTNITQDHFDYHQNFQNYINAKKTFFDMLPKNAFALSNADDRNGKIMLQNCDAKKYYYGIRQFADFQGKVMDSGINGLMLKLNELEMHSPLVGNFNAYNLTLVYAVASLLGHDKEEVLPILSGLGTVRGRFETILSEENIMGIIDYAHTPDALENVLTTINDIRTHNETLITVVGAGGNRDKSKRPLMGKIASELSDKVVFCSDNPRNEDPESILDDVIEGVEADRKSRYLRISDRKEAIRTAVMLAKPNDIILIAGKGHETYQEIKGVKYDFNDRKILIQMLKK